MLELSKLGNGDILLKAEVPSDGELGLEFFLDVHVLCALGAPAAMALKQPVRNVVRDGASSASAPPKVCAVKLRIQTECGRSVLEPRVDSGVAGSGKVDPLIGRADECRTNQGAIPVESISCPTSSKQRIRLSGQKRPPKCATKAVSPRRYWYFLLSGIISSI